ncbi:hypothetical protein [Paracandidimonas soli]|nr:hypothetical protein [Paracandidimonas soli]
MSEPSLIAPHAMHVAGVAIHSPLAAGKASQPKSANRRAAPIGDMA